MYDLFEKTLEQLGITTPRWFLWIVLAVVILIGVNFLLKKYVKPIVDYFEDLNERAIKIKELESEMTILKENQLRNVEHCKDNDSDLRMQIKEVSDKVSVVANMILEMQARIDEANKNKLREQIREIYAVHHQTQKITLMEREALEGLIDSYLAAKGNSFVAKTILPEIYCWEVVDDDYYTREQKEKLSKSYINEI